MGNALAISIIMPVYNAEATLPETLKSITDQTLQDFELICIDDHSTDRSLEILKEAGEQDSRIRVYTKDENGGPANARRDGIRLSQGKYVMFIDADDQFYPYTCERALEAIEANPCDILHFDCMGVQNGQLLNSPLPMRPYAGAIQGESMLEPFFGESPIDHVLWSKIYWGDLCRYAASRMSENIYNTPCDDYYTLFIIAYFAKSYIGMPDQQLYIYHPKTGYTADIAKVMHGANTVVECREFLSSENALDRYGRLIEHLANRIYTTCLQALMTTPRLDRGILEEAVRCWGAGLLVDVIEQTGFFAVETQDRLHLLPRLLQVALQNQQEQQAAAEPEAKPEEKAAEPEAKPEEKAEEPEAKPEEKAAEPETKPEVKAEKEAEKEAEKPAKEADKAAEKAAAKPEAKAEAKADKKTAKADKKAAKAAKKGRK